MQNDELPDVARQVALIAAERMRRELDDGRPPEEAVHSAVEHADSFVSRNAEVYCTEEGGVDV